MKPAPLFGLLVLARRFGKVESATGVAPAGATWNAWLGTISVALVACFVLLLCCTSAQAQDLALNNPASASSTEDNRIDLSPGLANDGDSSTRWSSNYVDNQWWQVDLGSVQEIDRVELNWETAYASSYRVQTRSSRGNSWSTAVTATISSPGLTVHTFPARDARYVRIRGDQRATPWGISLWDVQVFGPSSPPPSDGDGDGVPDSTDQCPAQPGPASNGGCPALTDCLTGQFLALYWSNQTLSGLPVLSRCEASINDDFGTGSPPGVPADGFSARYEGIVNFGTADYEFALTGDDGVRLWVDGDLVIDRWVTQAATTYRATRAMTAGAHDVKVEYYEGSGLADVQLAITKQVDTDRDGVSDSSDQCPGTPAGTAVDSVGCPSGGGGGGGGPPSGVTLREPDGGLNYYAQFTNPGRYADANFFPTLLWGQYDMTQANIATDKAGGFNGYDQLANRPGVNGEPSNMMDLVANAGMPAFVGLGWPTQYFTSAVVGYRMTDEPDMCNSPCPQNGFNTMANARAQAPQDGRMRFSNYGKGVLFWWGDQDASTFVNTPGNNDVFSADAYWFTDPDIEDQSQGQCLYAGCNKGNLTRDQRMRAYNYGLQVQRERQIDAMDGKRQPIFNQIEMARWEIDRGDSTITPAQMHGAFWQGIIFGARGVDYFPFSWGVSGHVTDHVQRSTDPYWRPIQDQAKADNQLAAQIAPVLNDNFADGYVSVSSGNDAMAKYHAGDFYVFAGNKDNQSKTATFTLAGVGSGTAEVVGENRNVPISGGQFSDAFADGNTIHIYRIHPG
jgi:F5/8 type C domain/PA14 domain/Thrombospondin type 3 repeat